MTTKLPPEAGKGVEGAKKEVGEAVKARRKELGLKNVYIFQEFLEKRGISTSTRTLNRLEQGHVIDGDVRDQIVEVLGLSGQFPSNRPVVIAAPIDGETSIRRLLDDLERDVFHSSIIGPASVQSLSFRRLIEGALNKFSLNFSSKGEIVEWRYPDPIPLDQNGIEFVIGPAGRGKSTYMKASFLTALKSYRTASKTIPVFYRAADFRTGFRQVQQILNRSGRKNVVFFIDGADEISISDQSLLFDEIISFNRSRCSFIISSRPELLWRLYTERWQISKDISSVVEVMEWDYFRDTLPYIAQYAKNMGVSHLVQAFERIGRVSGAISLLQKPINVSLMIYLLQYKKILSNHVESINGLYPLFAEFYDLWVSRESLRAPSYRTDPVSWPDVARQHEELALHFFLRPYEAFPIAKLPLRERILSDPAFANLLVFNTDPAAMPISVRGFSDDSFVDFLVSQRLVETIRRGKVDNILDALSTEYNNNVNAFIRSYFQLMSNAEREHFRDCLSECMNIADKNELVIAAEQAIYYIGRIGGEIEPKILETLFVSASNPLIRRSAALGAILYGNEKVDVEYANIVLTEESEDLINRSVQLLYFEDIYGSIFGHRDNGKVSWDRTRKAIVDRLSLQEGRSLQLRLWDLTTLHCFQRSRPQVRLSPDEVRILEICRHDEPCSTRTEKINWTLESIKILDQARKAGNK